MTNYISSIFKLVYVEYKDFCNRPLEKPEDNTLFKLILSQPIISNSIKQNEDNNNTQHKKDSNEHNTDLKPIIEIDDIKQEKDNDNNSVHSIERSYHTDHSDENKIGMGNLKRKSCDECFLDYLSTCLPKTNRNYFGYIFKVITLFREALNKFKPGDDRLSFPKNVEYTEVRNAELCPDLCNDFIGDFLDTAHYFGMKDENERNEVIDLMQHLCQWLFENGQTTSRLSLL